MQTNTEILTTLTNVDALQFKGVLRRFTSSVCIITAGYHFKFNGMTATAVCSVSAEPPSMLIAVNQENRSHALIENAGAFAINVLSSVQQSLAVHFSSRPVKPFAGINYRLGSVNSPIIEGCAAYLECVVDTQLRSGTHSIFVGRVVASGATEHLPLCYGNGEFLLPGKCDFARSPQ
jgi:flavin reductase